MYVLYFVLLSIQGGQFVATPYYDPAGFATLQECKQRRDELKANPANNLLEIRCVKRG